MLIWLQSMYGGDGSPPLMRQPCYMNSREHTTKDTIMRIANPINETSHFYAGKCKGNTAPKHVTLIGESRKIKLEGKNATMYNSPKSDYIYIKQGDVWLWVKDKSIFELESLTAVPVTRTAKAVAETPAQPEA